MRFIAFLLCVACALGLSFLAFADAATFDLWGRKVVGLLAFLVWVCLAGWLFAKMEL